MNDDTTAVANPPAPEDVLIVLPVRDIVLFPGVVLPIAISGKRALAAAQEAVRTQRRVGLLLQKNAVEEPDGDDLHRVGTAASIVRFVTAPDGSHHLICQGEQRFTVLDFVSRDPFLVARIETHKEATVLDREVEARGLNLRERAIEALQLLPQAPAELTNRRVGAGACRHRRQFHGSQVRRQTGHPRDLRSAEPS
jgi:ATP-dependent Lon protease